MKLPGISTAVVLLTFPTATLGQSYESFGNDPVKDERASERRSASSPRSRPGSVNRAACQTAIEQIAKARPEPGWDQELKKRFTILSKTSRR